MDNKLMIVGIAGSLRRESYNKKLLTAAGKLFPEYVDFKIADISEIPLFSEDLEDPLPDSVTALKRLVEAADGLLISTPEYNNSVPGVLKNVLDWLSRPPKQSSLNEKPLAIIGASPGMFGTISAQTHLRQITSFLNMRTIDQPRVFIGSAHTKFDSEGNLNDTIAVNLLQSLMNSLTEAAASFQRRQ